MTLINSNTLKGRCVVCGAESAACGGPTNHEAVDVRVVEEERMAEELYEYEVQINGRTTTMKLTEDRANKLYPGARKVGKNKTPAHDTSTGAVAGDTAGPVGAGVVATTNDDGGTSVVAGGSVDDTPADTKADVSPADTKADDTAAGNKARGTKGNK